MPLEEGGESLATSHEKKVEGWWREKPHSHRKGGGGAGCRKNR